MSGQQQNLHYGFHHRLTSASNSSPFPKPPCENDQISETFMTRVFLCDSLKGVWAFYKEGTGCKTDPLQLQTAVAVFSCQRVSSSCGLQHRAHIPEMPVTL